MNQLSGWLEPAQAISSPSPIAATPKASAPNATAAGRARIGQSATSAKTVAYSAVRFAASQATPWSSAQPIDRKLQPAYANSRTAAIAVVRGSGDRRGSASAARTSAARRNTAPGYQVVGAYPPLSRANMMSTGTT